MSDDRDDELTYGIVMPFVVCQSQGGAFDDDAFVAGFRCGSLDAELSIMRKLDAVLAEPEPFMSREAELTQLDLIAMRHGFVMEAERADDEWFRVTIKQVADAPS